MAAPRPPNRLSSFICQSCRQRRILVARRPFSTNPKQLADKNDPLSALSSLSGELSQNRRQSFNNEPSARAVEGQFTNMLDQGNDESLSSLLSDTFSQNLNAGGEKKPHRLHIYATKHNTHITFIQPPTPASQMASAKSGPKTKAAQSNKLVDMVFSLSAGNIGFRKAGRGSYDAAYQLAAFAFKQLGERGITREIKSLEVVLRGFGAGREAVTKALLGTEGRHIRSKITAVVDATRLKQGGPRAPKPRRLG